MAKFWAWIRDPLNLAVIMAAGGAVAWLWNAIAPVQDQPQRTVTGQIAEAESGTAINAKDNAEVRINTPSETLPADAKPSASQPKASSASGQQAAANNGGIAINASDQANVNLSVDK